MPTRSSALAGGLLLSLPLLLSSTSAQEALPWQRGAEPRYQPRDDGYRQNNGSQRQETPDDEEPAPNRPGRSGDGYPGSRPSDPYAPRYSAPGIPSNDAYSPRYGSPRAPADDAYRPPQYGQGYEAPRNAGDAYAPPRPGYAQGPYPPSPGQPYGQPSSQPSTQGYGQPNSAPGQPYGRPYTPPGEAYDDPRERRYGSADNGRRYEPGPRHDDEVTGGSYSTREILDAGHGFFGSVSKGLASVVEYAFQKQGRPNGYILGQDAGGAFVAGLRYGEGILYTKDAGHHRVYWQGPSIGYDAGAEGSKVLMLVYNLRDPEEIYQRFGGVDGSAYLVGGVGVTFQKNAHVIVAPIRSGIGLRLGANIGYLKYTRRPTWNPF
jgi:hypothetical protein